jgi:hypothetical protein
MNLKSVNRPSGTGRVSCSFPAVETAGYYRKRLRRLEKLWGLLQHEGEFFA